jgi:hypothetical protein
MLSLTWPVVFLALARTTVPSASQSPVSSRMMNSGVTVSLHAAGADQTYQMSHQCTSHSGLGLSLVHVHKTLVEDDLEWQVGDRWPQPDIAASFSST